MLRIAWVLALAGCGRFGFGVLGTDVELDASAADTNVDAEEVIDPQNLLLGWSAQMTGSGSTGVIHVHDIVVGASGRVSVGLHFDRSTSGRARRARRVAWT